MRKPNVGFLLTVLFSVLLVVDVKKPYPDWSCYPGFDENFIEYITELCEGWETECVKSCIFKLHSMVSDSNYKTLRSEDSMVGQLSESAFRNHEESSKIIAKKALAACSHLSNDAEEPKCSHELEDCIEKATAC